MDLASYLKCRGVPELFLGSSFSNFENGDALIQALKGWLEKPEWSLTLYGKVGCGKTHLSVAIMRELCQRGCRSLVFKNVKLLLDEIREASFKKSEHSEGHIINLVSDASFLILDDFGVGKDSPSDWKLETLYRILDARYSSRKMTVITTNLTMQGIDEMFGERIASRLACGKLIHNAMPDRRKVEKLYAASGF